jgi:isopentenyldiphosphate isomerase
VNEDDQAIGVKERADTDLQDLYRVSALWLTNGEGQVLMAQRAFTKKKDPGVWGPAVAGTVEEGETYESNIIKETEEEIGLHVKPKELTPGPHMRIHKPAGGGYFLQWFMLERDVPIEDIRIAPDEVAQAQWFTKDELHALFMEHPEQFTPAAGQWLPEFLH